MEELTLNIAFDQYQRYRTASDLIRFFRSSDQNTKFRILELGSNSHKDLGLFLPDDDIVYSDICLTEEMKADPQFQLIDGTQMELPAESFDFVVALDVLEHVPEEKRLAFLENVNRIARKGAIISFPYESDLVYAAEERVNSYYKAVSGEDFIWLKEHKASGLPNMEKLSNVLQNTPHFSFYHGTLDVWEKMWYAHFTTVFSQETLDFRTKIDRFYNTALYKQDRDSACYRSFLVLAKQQQAAWEQYAEALFSPTAISTEAFKTLDLICDAQKQAHTLYMQKKEFELVQKIDQTTAEQVEQMKCLSRVSHHLDLIMGEKQQELDNMERQLFVSEKENVQLADELSQYVEDYENALAQIGLLSHQINSMQNAFFWKITKPLRKAGSFIKRIVRSNRFSLLTAKGLLSIKRHGLRYTWQKLRSRKAIQHISAYTPEELEAQRAAVFSNNIRFSILVPLYNTPELLLQEMIDSVVAQTYSNWELCLADGSDQAHGYVETICRQYAKKNDKIRYMRLEKNEGIVGNTNACAKMATGDYIALLDHDDLLASSALYENARAIEKTGAMVLYSDEEHITEDGVHRGPFYKPDWSPDLLYSQMYICHFLVFKRELFEKIGGFRADYNGGQDYDLMLGFSELTDRICHIPRMLYFWRETPNSTAANPDAKPYAHTAGFKALDRHLKTKYDGKAYAEETPYPFVYHARFRNMEDEPLVSIIIPMKDHCELTDTAIKSILEKSTYRHFEILILDNLSVQQDTFAWFEAIQKQEPRVRVILADMPFNWSKLNNFGISQAEGEIFIFLNNDTVVITPDWIERLCENALRDDVGAVGPLLLYEDNTIQHAGVVVGMNGWADHVFKGMDAVHNGCPFVSPIVSRNVLAVTGACMAISKKTLLKIGLFDEEFVICGSDVEICLRANEQGLYNVYDASVRLYHLESKSRDSFIPKIDFYKSKNAYAPYLRNTDPYYNVNLDYYKTTPAVAAARGEFAQFQNYLSKFPAAVPTQEADAQPVSVSAYRVAEITPIYARKSIISNGGLRLNLIIPSLDEKHVFGGIATALKFFDALQEECGCDVRIITVDAEVNLKTTVSRPGYFLVDSTSDYSFSKQIISFADRAKKTISVHEKDVFMATGWWTAYTISQVLKWQSQTYHTTLLPLVYFIQDYEPGFYPWSSRYLMADSTYHMDIPTLAIFNSTLLQNFFKQNGYVFEREWSFDPSLNEKLLGYLQSYTNPIQKKKQILVYGRPNTDRNAFELLVASLKEWCVRQEDRTEWTVLSAGEPHPDVDLGYGVLLRSMGKLTLDAYAETLLNSYAGISLMVSPHPSYPPLEMAAFGVKTVTNPYANKNLSEFSPNLFSVTQCSSDAIGAKLAALCSAYHGQGERMTEGSYLEPKDAFQQIASDIREQFKVI